METRDTEVAISLWNEKVEQFGNPPPIGEFSFADPVAQSFRFMIGADLLASDDWVFLAYGVGFAKLLGLSERLPMRVPMIRCIPHRYRFLFLQGCGEAFAEAVPLRFSGEMAGLGGSELYRACFMPLKTSIDTMRAIYGSFNFRFRTAAELAERSQSADAAGGPTLPDLPLSVAKN